MTQAPNHLELQVTESPGACPEPHLVREQQAHSGSPCGPQMSLSCLLSITKS